ncbi:MAG: type IV pilus modification protein PilV [Gammaproteobacteria bacterium]|nr:type IV pilus modification protein PilV [Gammaproteobacteria bacterium]
MLELFVALLVTSVGVLGIAGLTTLNAQHRRSAAAHAEAVRLAEDIIERIRANPAGLQAGGYAVSGDAVEGPDCHAGQCAAAEMAAFDLAQWRCALGTSTTGRDCRGPLDAAGAVATDVSAGSVRITIRWRDQGESRTLTVDSGD